MRIYHSKSILIAVFFSIVVLGCNSAPDFVRKLRQYKNVVEMSRFSEHDKLKKLADRFKTNPTKVKQLVEAYGRNSTNMKKKIMYFSWVLAHEAEKTDKDAIEEHLNPFLKRVCGNTKNKKASHWAAAGLVLMASAQNKEVFLKWLGTDEPVMWKHGANGLLKIGTPEAFPSLVTVVESRNKDNDFLKEVKNRIKKYDLASSKKEKLLNKLDRIYPGEAEEG